MRRMRMHLLCVLADTRTLQRLRSDLSHAGLLSLVLSRLARVALPNGRPGALDAAAAFLVPVEPFAAAAFTASTQRRVTTCLLRGPAFRAALAILPLVHAGFVKRRFRLGRPGSGRRALHD